MCGINGLFGLEGIAAPEALVHAMNKRIAHRGPDADGVALFDQACLGHQRLSILDLSSAAVQPMTDASGRYTLIFNGEVYNYREIKKGLEHYPFKTTSDTEVVLAAFAEYGPAALQLFNGMFALAIWDDDKQELLIARDRMGIKPLYYSHSGQSILFSSEIKGLLASGLIKPVLDKSTLSEYLCYQTVHEPKTILKDVLMLPAAHYMILRDTDQQVVRYWSPGQSREESSGQSKAQIEKRVFELLQSSVERRMISDVPFGAFLSGGIDSSAMVGLMASLTDTQVSTFNISFDDSEFSEARYARMVAERFGTAHHEIELKPDDFLQMLPQALGAMDHPTGDGPNTYLVSKVTKEAGITVAISGLGGDELFAGYDLFKHSVSAMDKRWLSQYPMFLRKLAAAGYSCMKPGIASKKAGKLLTALRMELPYLYPVMRQVLMDEELERLKVGKGALIGMRERLLAMDDHWRGLPKLSQVTVAEMETYMRNVLLRDTDQMSMPHALEVRVPFLDHELVQYVIGISDEVKYPHSPKSLLIDSLGSLLPSEIVNRPKMGFTLPWRHWMKNELKEFCGTRIEALADRGIMDAQALRALWQRFNTGDPSITWSRVWPLIVLENWLQTYEVET